MTVLEVSAKLFEWYSKQDALYLSNKAQKDDFQGVILISDNSERDRACLVAALQDYEKAEIVKAVPSKEGTYYFLNKPFQAYDQTLSIDSQTALQVAQVINQFCEKVNDKTDQCDATKIRCKDIKNLLLLVLHFSGCNKEGEKTA